MSNSSLNSPKDTISLAFDSFGDKENYNTPLYLYKSKIVRGEGLNLLSVKLQISVIQIIKIYQIDLIILTKVKKNLKQISKMQ